MTPRNITRGGPLLFLFLGAVLNGSSTGTQRTSKIFIANDADHHQWCAYPTQSAWQSDVKLFGSGIVATLTSAQGRLSSIEVTTEDEAGDWIVYDHYTVSTDGTLQEDKRKINILPGDRSVEESYLIRDGKAKKQSSTTKSLSTGKSLASSEDWVPEVSVIARLKDFPFASLIRTATDTDSLLRGRECVASRP